MNRAALTLSLVLALASAASARQEDEREKLKKSILDKVKARIDEENRRILDRVGKIIDEELAKTPAKSDADRKIAELEARLKALEDQRAAAQREMDEARRKHEARMKELEALRADIARQIEAIRKGSEPPKPAEDEEAKIKADARKKGPQDLEEAQQLFQEALNEHNNAEYKSSILKFKYVFYQFADNPIGWSSAYNVACGYALAGEKDKACDWLEISIKHGFKNYDHIRKDTDLDSIRNEKKYKQLMADK